MPTFGENLKELRKSRGYSQDRFAREIGSNQVNVSAWELGTRMPTIPTIQHIANVFHVPLSSLISLESTGREEDGDRELLDLIKNNPKIRQLVDKARYLSDEDMSTILNVAQALVRAKV